jgi:Uma2 family endonuclease
MSEQTHSLHRWTRSEYHRMVATGVFPPEARLELLDGEIVEMSAQKGPHASAVDLVEEALRVGFGKGFYVRGQKPLRLDDYSEPEPDIALVEGSIRDYADHHPTAAILVVEVADTTLAYDRLNKAAVYARTGIPEYWILNLRDRCLEVYRRPAAGAYSERILLIEGETVSPLADPGLRIEVADLLP